MKRRLSTDQRHTVPVAAAAVGSRLATLAVIAVASATLSKPNFDLVIYALAVSTAVQILLDPAVSNLVAVRWSEVDRASQAKMFQSGLRLQALAGVAMALTAGLFVVAARGGTGSLFLGLALGTLAAVEGVARYARVVCQVDGRFGRYAAVDVLIGVGRVLIALALVVHHSTTALGVASLLWAGVIAVGIVVWASRRRRVSTDVASLAREVWPYGLSTFFSSLYSQAPTVILGIAGDLQAAAVYAVAARITQPTELLPAAISSVYLPRLAREGSASRQSTFITQGRLAFALGLAVAFTIATAGQFVLRVLGVAGQGAPWVLVILASLLPVKFLNYQLVALALADGRVKQRLRASLVVGVISVTTVVFVAHTGAVPVAVTTLVCECILCLLLVRASHSTSLVPRLLG